jgi:hypothetical protein
MRRDPKPAMVCRMTPGWEAQTSGRVYGRYAAPHLLATDPMTPGTHHSRRNDAWPRSSGCTGAA